MTTVKIELPDQQAAELSAVATAKGMTLEDFVGKIFQNAAGVIDWSQCPAVESVPGKVSGAWVLKGSRMPVATIFENLEAGANIDDIVDWFAGVDRTQVEEVIEFAKRSLDKPPAFAGR